MTAHGVLLKLFMLPTVVLHPDAVVVAVQQLSIANKNGPHHDEQPKRRTSESDVPNQKAGAAESEWMG